MTWPCRATKHGRCPLAIRQFAPDTVHARFLCGNYFNGSPSPLARFLRTFAQNTRSERPPESSCRMFPMRAIFVLATILCLAAPQVAWGAINLSSQGTSSMSMAAPSATTSQLIRAIAKAEKTFSYGHAIAHASSIVLAPADYTRSVVLADFEPPSLDPDQPPLAPRPPPL